MPTLAMELRNKLEKVVVEARDVAEAGARAALEALAVHHYEPYPHMKSAQRTLRNQLRARARQLGDRQDSTDRLTIDHLVGECAYDHWHRMLFARFLAENNLLIEPQENMAISLAEAEELAKEEGVDVWVHAARCAERMLPQIFRPDDPLLQVSFATEHQIKLEGLLASLPSAAFTASDALGWVYQFWQSKKKEEVNRSEVKIGADEISAVTQLFTEPYMVNFLLHNTLGAWWAAKRLTAEDRENAETEQELRNKLALPGVEWTCLRFVRGAGDKGGPWRPAAGAFDGWPRAAKDIKVLDPCCGSGHFLVAALHHLVPIRMGEEGLSAREAVDAVLRDNLHGLEIDERCCQIAAFALAFAAWTYPEAGGYRLLPELHIACTGIGPQATEEQWLKLAEQSGIPMPTVGREAIKNGLRNLHRLFSQAPTLGSLINPAELPADLIAADYETIRPYLTAIREVEKVDDETRERAIAAAGMVKAADLLAGEYTLVITNVPYLGQNKQDDLIKHHLGKHFPPGKADLATAFVLRCLETCSAGGTTAVVTPQNWLFLTTYAKLRKLLLERRTWNVVAKLGENAFESSAAAGAFAAMLALTVVPPGKHTHFAGVDVSAPRGQRPILAEEKAAMLRGDVDREIAIVPQSDQLKTPDSRITFGAYKEATLLSEYASSYWGIGTGDIPRFVRKIWEVGISYPWQLLHSTFFQTNAYVGRDEVVYFLNSDDASRLPSSEIALREANRWTRGSEGWGRHGIAIHLMSGLSASLYTGEIFQNGVAVIVPDTPDGQAPIWSFCSAPDFRQAIRRIDQKVSVTNYTLLKVPFDLAHWRKIAAEKYPHGLPEPESDDPTQWLFHGRPDEAQEGTELQVAVARLLGYRWPAELDDKMHLSKRARGLVKECERLLEFADDDGIVCIPSVRGEEPAADRLFALLDACDIEPEVDLDDWLRNEFFEEHCKLFHDRPFVWHIWDGRKRDGFHALVNYHRLAEGDGKGRKVLESLTYSYLGDWITRQKDEVKRGEGGAEDRLAAALELQKRLIGILHGETYKNPSEPDPEKRVIDCFFDIFVRWKPLHEQPIGWEPDINDGVRLNIRPFLASDLPTGRAGAGVLRWKPNIKWTKDRGKEPERPKAEYPWFWNWDERTEDFKGGKTFDGNRWNNCHYTNKTKQQARDTVKKGDG